MIRFLKLLLTGCLLMTCTFSYAGQVRKIVPISKVFACDSQYEGEWENIRDRLPTSGIYCVIDTDEGVYLSGVDKEDDIVSYEIWDSPTNCIGVYYDEINFVKKVVMTTTTCKIRINTDQLCYEGILNK